MNAVLLPAKIIPSENKKPGTQAAQYKGGRQNENDEKRNPQGRKSKSDYKDAGTGDAGKHEELYGPGRTSARSS